MARTALKNTSACKKLAVILLMTAMLGSFISCAQLTKADCKISTALAHQVDIKRQFLLSGDELLLKQMRDEGLMTANVSEQKALLYVKNILGNEEELKLKEVGVKIIVDSWLPAMAGNPYGSYIAEIPVDKIEKAAYMDFVVRIDTAEGEGVTGCKLNRR